jgi:hypothetical protein
MGGLGRRRRQERRFRELPAMDEPAVSAGNRRQKLYFDF